VCGARYSHPHLCQSKTSVGRSRGVAALVGGVAAGCDNVGGDAAVGDVAVGIA
jgi:hypothetical protein